MASPSPVFANIRVGLITVSAVQIFWLAYHAFVVDNRNRGGDFRVRFLRAASTFNILLLLIILANIGSYAGILIQAQATSVRTYLLGLLVVTLSSSCVNHGYICYTWNRGSPLVEITSPRTFPYARAFIKYVPFTFYTTPIPTLVQLAIPTFNSTQISRGLHIACASAVLVFDVYIIVMYARYLALLNEFHPNQHDAHLDVISRYGIAASVAAILSLASFTVRIVYGEQLPGQIAWAATQVFAFLMHTALLLMKVALARHKTREETEKLRTVESAKGRTLLTHSHGSSRHAQQ
ncbi:hypothetical protein HDU78_000219 [Chytriomyces hyalinus]|nr:hypothetical protein HDU78_000219 [Chytriomyces hyalinus]